MEHFDIVFSGPPSGKDCSLVETETPDRASFALGTWLKRDDGYWVIRVTREDAQALFGFESVQRCVVT